MHITARLIKGHATWERKEKQQETIKIESSPYFLPLDNHLSSYSNMDIFKPHTTGI